MSMLLYLPSPKHTWNRSTRLSGNQSKGCLKSCRIKAHRSKQSQVATVVDSNGHESKRQKDKHAFCKVDVFTVMSTIKEKDASESEAAVVTNNHLHTLDKHYAALLQLCSAEMGKGMKRNKEIANLRAYV